MKSNLEGWKYTHNKVVMKKLDKVLTVIVLILFLAMVMMFVLYPMPKEVVASEETQDVNLDEETIKVIEDTCYVYHICPELVEAIIEAESSCNEEAISPSKKHYGLMQIGVYSHARRLDKYGLEPDDLFESEYNILVGVGILADLFEEYEDLPVVLMKYEGYSDYDAITRAVEGRIPAYTNHIMNRAMELERLHGK